MKENVRYIKTVFFCKTAGEKTRETEKFNENCREYEIYFKKVQKNY